MSTVFQPYKMSQSRPHHHHRRTNSFGDLNQPPGFPKSKSFRLKTNSSSNSQQQQQQLSSSNWSLASSVDSAERASLGSVSSLPLPMSTTATSGGHQSIDLLTRTSWIDAAIALRQIEKCKANGNKSALWLRATIQYRFADLGHIIQRNAANILFFAILILVTLGVGLKSVTIEQNVEKLWVEEGGRLEKETQYIRQTLGDGVGNTNQIVIQTPRANSGSVLHTNSLLLHLEALRVALTTTVDLFDITWRLKDICYSPSSPTFDRHYLDSMFENLIPCGIVTPLDCFWEGSKLLGPEFPVPIPYLGIPVQWTNLNPELLVDSMATAMKSSTATSSGQKISPNANGPLEIITKFMKRAGITSAYQKKPCLDPKDLNCPTSAPNYESGAVPDIGAELTGGCYGFATKYMHWPEEMIVGGVVRNKTGHIVKAKALQSIVQLMGEREMFEFHQQSYKVHNIDWSMDKARIILETWQRKFSWVLRSFMESTDFVGSKHNEIHLFTSTSLMDIMKQFSNVKLSHIAIGYLAMLLYAGVSLFNCSRSMLEKSQSVVGMVGVLLIALATTAGLGVCALLGLPFNATTTQIVPFLALGLGIDNLFLLAHTYSSNYIIHNVPYEHRTAECLKQTGCNLSLSLIGNIVAFLAAAIIPIPALRCFALQTAILITFISFAVIILFPALVSLDLRFRSQYQSRQSSQQHQPYSPLSDVCGYLCCVITPLAKTSPPPPPPQCSEQVNSSQANSPCFYPQPYNCYYIQPKCNTEATGTTTAAAAGNRICQCEEGRKLINSWNGEEETNDEAFTLMQRCGQCGGDLRTQCDGKDEDERSESRCSEPATGEEETTKRGSKLLTKYVIGNLYATFLERKPVKALVLATFVLSLVFSVFGILNVNDGLDLTDIVPHNTMEHRFLHYQREYFNFFNIFAVTKGNFDYPNNQKLLYEYHQSFTRVDAIVKNDDGALPEFWLSSFRDWLAGLQEAFDRDWKLGCIRREKWFANASEDGILAYKLLVQTGRVDNPVDKSLVYTSRLIDDQGIINPKAFYNYLTAWVSNDPLAYSASQASFRPEPRHWIHESNDVELKIPKSPPLVFAQIPFFVNNIRTTPEIIGTIEEIRTICRRFEDRSLPNFPTGIPFTYWEQYVRLRFYLFSALFIVLAAIFLSICVFLLNPWTAIIIVFILTINIIQLFGFMGWMGLKLSAIPAVILIVSVAISLDLLAQITIGFLVSIGDRNKRMQMSLEHTFAPVMNGIISTLFGISMLAFSEFDFIIRYFFYVLVAVVVISTFNTLVLLPVLLTIVGPVGEIIPLEHEDRISTPSPPPSPVNPHHAYYDNLMATMIVEPGRKSRGHSVFYKYRSRRRAPPRVQSEISLSTISEEPSQYQSSVGNTPTPPGAHPICAATASPHEIVVQPEFLVETTITNNPVNGITTNTFQMGRNTSLTPTSENGSTSVSSPSPTSDRDSPSGRSESVASNSNSTASSTVRSGSRCGSATSFTTTTTTSTSTPSTPSDQQQQQPQSTTVTTKVMATAKLKVELHPPPSASNTSTFMPASPYGYNLAPGAIYMAPAPYQHTHRPNEQCRNCLGSMAQPPPPPPPAYGYQTSPGNQSNYRSGAWNHGMLGPNRNSKQQQQQQQQYNWR